MDKTSHLVAGLVSLVIWVGNLLLAWHYYDRSDVLAFILFRVVIVLAALLMIYHLLRWRGRGFPDWRKK